jgi:hypothetical protein
MTLELPDSELRASGHMRGQSMKRILLGVAMMVASSGAFALVGGAPAIASASTPRPYVCSGGSFPTNPVPVPSGTYTGLIVTGFCQAPAGAEITVTGNVTVALGGAFDAQTYPSTVTVGGSVLVGANSLLGLGCDPNPPGHQTGHPCVDAQGNPTTAASDITIHGSILAQDATLVLLNGITVKGSVALNGSTGTATEAERANAIPWAIKLNTIDGSFIAANMDPIWIGLGVNHIGGTVIMFNIHITDGLPPNDDPTPSIQIFGNTVGGSLVCFGLGPAVSDGAFLPGTPNTVGGAKLGQCANLQAG